MRLVGGVHLLIFLINSLYRFRAACGESECSPHDEHQFCYTFLLNVTVNWTNGKEICEDANSRLPVIRSECIQRRFIATMNMSNWFIERFSARQETIIPMGLQEDPDGITWKWVDGSDLNSSGWSNWSWSNPPTPNVSGILYAGLATSVDHQHWIWLKSTSQRIYQTVACQRSCNKTIPFVTSSEIRGPKNSLAKSKHTVRSSSMTSQGFPAKSRHTVMSSSMTSQDFIVLTEKSRNPNKFQIPTKPIDKLGMDVILIVLIGLVTGGLVFSAFLGFITYKGYMNYKPVSTNRSFSAIASLRQPEPVPAGDKNNCGSVEFSDTVIKADPKSGKDMSDHDLMDESDTLRDVPSLARGHFEYNDITKSLRHTSNPLDDALPKF